MGVHVAAMGFTVGDGVTVGTMAMAAVVGGSSTTISVSPSPITPANGVFSSSSGFTKIRAMTIPTMQVSINRVIDRILAMLTPAFLVFPLITGVLTHSQTAQRPFVPTALPTTHQILLVIKYNASSPLTAVVHQFQSTVPDKTPVFHPPLSP